MDANDGGADGQMNRRTHEGPVMGCIPQICPNMHSRMLSIMDRDLQTVL